MVRCIATRNEGYGAHCYHSNGTLPILTQSQHAKVQKQLLLSRKRYNVKGTEASKVKAKSMRIAVRLRNAQGKTSVCGGG